MSRIAIVGLAALAFAPAAEAKSCARLHTVPALPTVGTPAWLEVSEGAVARVEIRSPAGTHFPVWLGRGRDGVWRARLFFTRSGLWRGGTAVALPGRGRPGAVAAR